MHFSVEIKRVMTYSEAHKSKNVERNIFYCMHYVNVCIMTTWNQTNFKWVSLIEYQNEGEVHTQLMPGYLFNKRNNHFPFCTINYKIYINHSSYMQAQYQQQQPKISKCIVKETGKAIIENGNKREKQYDFQMKTMFRMPIWLKCEKLFSNNIEKDLHIYHFVRFVQIYRRLEFFFLLPSSPILISENRRHNFVK